MCFVLLVNLIVLVIVSVCSSSMQPTNIYSSFCKIFQNQDPGFYEYIYVGCIIANATNATSVL